MNIVGYSDKVSVQPGENIKFMVSSKLDTYTADIVRLIHGDDNPKGPGFKEEFKESLGEYKGREQHYPKGSYVIIPDNPVLRNTCFTIQAWIYPTLPKNKLQGIVTKWSDNKGYGLFIDEEGCLTLRIGNESGEESRLSSNVPLRPSTWYFVAASYDGETGKAILKQEEVTKWPVKDSDIVIENSLGVKNIGENNYQLLLGAFGNSNAPGDHMVCGHYNGKIDSPRIFRLNLNADQINSLKDNNLTERIRDDLVAEWDFSVDISSIKVLLKFLMM